MAPTPDATDSAAAVPAVGEASGATTGDTPAERQPIVRVRGARRARLLAAPGTSAEPAPADDPTRDRPSAPAASGPNDAQLLRDVPPHY